MPSYVRTELKKKTGIVINEYGEKIDETIEDNKISYETKDPNNFMFNTKEQSTQLKQQKKNYTPINSYRPSGNLVYEEELLSKIEDKFL